MQLRGRFELHVTVAALDGVVTTFAHRHGMKLTCVELKSGDSRLQPMLSWRSSGTLAEVLDEGRRCAARLGREGSVVTRIKIEAAPGNEGVPREDLMDATPRYFEHHVKLLLRNSRELETLEKLAEPHGARLSRNALRTRSDGYEERFLTQRCTHVGARTARERLDQLERTLRDAGCTVLEVEQEYVVFDSNLALDAGWFEASGR